MRFRELARLAALLGIAWSIGWAASRPASSGEIFLDVTGSAGISWTHVNPRSPQRYLPETVGGGAAFLDFNGDGRLDLYLVNSGTPPFLPDQSHQPNALYRNNGDGTFTDVTAAAGVAGQGFGMGAAAADYDGDGWTDLLVTGLESSLLYRNRGDSTFQEVSRAAGLSAPGWSTSAAWFDSNNDGRLDLFICGFLRWSPDLPLCGEEGRREYCLPHQYPGAPSRLFLNRGDGTFQDVSRRAGVDNPEGKGLGVVAADIDGDGWMDIFEANDTVRNFLYRNQGDGTFTDIGVAAGVAFSRDGRPRSGMGVAAQDYDQDGRVDLFVDNLNHELYSLYRNEGPGVFSDEALLNPDMVRASFFMSGWGVRFLDLENDGDFDLLVVNGHPNDRIESIQPPVTYRQRPVLFENLGGRFQPTPLRGILSRPMSARGLAVADYDNDGDPDLLICNNGEAPLLLRNQAQKRGRWLGLRLLGRRSNRQGVGSWIVYRCGGVTRRFYVAGGGSYLSSHDPRILLGLGQHPAEEVIIHWPSGTVDILQAPPTDRYLEVVEGLGAVR